LLQTKNVYEFTVRNIRGKTELAIRNGQSGDTGNIGETRYRMKKNNTNSTKQKAKRISKKDLTKHQV
jgi:hypothetical protein